MTQEEKTEKSDVEKTTEQTTEEENTEETQKEGTEEESTEESSSKEDIDYGAIQKEEEDRVNKPDVHKAQEAFNERKEKREEEVIEDEDKPLTRKELLGVLAQERTQNQKEAQGIRALEIARANTSSEAEAQATIVFWKSRVVPTGDLAQDVLFAVGGLNHKRLISKNNELSRALKSKDGLSRDTASTHREGQQGNVPKMSSADATALKQAGFQWDGAKRLYKKELPNKKTLFKDPKTKKTWVA